jgi:hypothetical protein
MALIYVGMILDDNNGLTDDPWVLKLNYKGRIPQNCRYWGFSYKMFEMRFTIAAKDEFLIGNYEAQT